MANFTQAVSSTINCFGIEPADLWGTMLWGGKWAYGDNALPTGSESLSTMSTGILSDGFSIIPESVQVESQAFTGVGTSEQLSDGSGFNYVFTDPSIEAELRNISTYTVGTSLNPGWISAPSAGGNWV